MSDRDRMTGDKLDDGTEGEGYLVPPPFRDHPWYKATQASTMAVPVNSKGIHDYIDAAVAVELERTRAERDATLAAVTAVRELATRLRTTARTVSSFGRIDRVLEDHDKWIADQLDAALGTVGQPQEDPNGR